MTEEAQIQSVALFYFFSLLDESIARQATFSTIHKCQSRARKLGLAEDKFPAIIVHCTNQLWERYRKIKVKGHASISYEAGWLLPESVDMGTWKEFQRESDPSEFLAVVWSQVLKLKDSDISEGLGVTEGTVRHRVGRGLRLLGKLRK